MNKSPNLTSHAAWKAVSPRRAFTLVELMVVIVIIGIIAGFALPAVFRAVTAARQGAYKLEVDTLADAVEKYRSKYGDYPPDGSNWAIMERHLRKAFPQILQSELDLLNPAPANLAGQGWSGSPWNKNVMAGVIAGIRNDFDQSVVTPTYAATDLKVMDPAEALVFFLGGFSSNPQRPFTGPGGPFLATGIATGQVYQYNIQRTNAFFDFKLERLSLEQELVGTVPVTISHDEEVYLGSAAAEDLLPVYLSRADIENSAPFVYFDARTYAQMKGANPYLNFYQRTAVATTPGNDSFGAIRPLMSATLRTPPIAAAAPTLVDWIRQYLFLEDKKFQVLGAGIDDIYGGRIAGDFSMPSVNEVAAAFISFPSGRSYKTGDTSTAPANRIYDRLQLPRNSNLYSLSLGLADNAANCLEGSTFFNSLSAPATK
jgi:prepilin-type N-terminal cleavage/methylation domain-containing protein